jgi:uncharacterized protein DUF4911
MVQDFRMPKIEKIDELPPATISTLVLEMPPERIALFKAIIESYDNLATLRTEDPRRHRLKLYFAPQCAEPINRLIDSMADELSIKRIPPLQGDPTSTA